MAVFLPPERERLKPVPMTVLRHGDYLGVYRYPGDTITVLSDLHATIFELVEFAERQAPAPAEPARRTARARGDGTIRQA